MRAVAISLLCCLALTAGCAGGAEAPGRPANNAPNNRPLAERIAPTTGVSHRTVLLPIGTVPYNLDTLPMLSPDGRHVACETGASVDRATRQGLYGASVPAATKIELYRLVDPPADGQELVEFVTRLDGGILLGRSANESGFIVEKPTADGSRWIGFVEWATGNLTWLVQDEFVNAFAALGDARSTDVLAWSRRTFDGLDFELVVRRGDEQWTMARPDTSYLYPSWARSGDGLFTVEFEGTGRISTLFMHGDGEVMMRQTARAIGITTRGTADLAFQMMAPFPAMVGDVNEAAPMLLFFHPDYLAVGVWRPFRTGASATRVLERQSFAAVVDNRGSVYYAVGDEFVSRPLDAREPRVQVDSHYWVPRLTTHPDWPLVLMAAVDGQPRIRLMGVQAVGRIEYTD